MKHSMLFPIVFATASLVISCEKENPFDSVKISGEGEPVSRSLELETIRRIELQGVANFYVSVGTAQEVTLKAQQNIIDVMTWEVSSGTLFIGLKQGVSLENHEEIRLDISLEQLTDLFHEGVGNMTLEGFSQEALHIDHRGIGNIMAFELPLNQCVVQNSGTGDCSVLVNEYLEVDISALGNVYYKGTPQISFTDSGLGDLVNHNK